MSIIEELKQGLQRPWEIVNLSDKRRAEMIAWLERLEKPTQLMKDAFDHAPGPATGWYALKVMLKAAEEDLP